MESRPFNRVAEIDCRLEANDGVVVEFLDELEVSLDCISCKCKHRTIIFQLGSEWGRCTPTKKCAGFFGRLVSKTPSSIDNNFSVRYEVEYAYEPFVDVKYGDESNGEPTWARVHFVVTCPKCQERITWETQNNLVRPWSHVCTCGKLLYTENNEMPLLGWHSKGTT